MEPPRLGKLEGQVSQGSSALSASEAAIEAAWLRVCGENAEFAGRGPDEE
jgi:hypothetical protein